MQEALVKHAQLREWCIRKFVGAGVSERDAAVAADVLVHANLRGVDSHGVMRMPHYIDTIAANGLNVNPHMRIRDTGPVTAIVDGDDGLGHVVAEKAMSHAIEKAKLNGVGAVSAVNSSHCGALSYFVNMAADQGLIGVMMTNTDKMVAPFGGSAPYFGTNPMAFAFPAGDLPPIIVDMATSSVAYGKILDAIRQGKPIPPDWAVNEAGEPITDPALFSALLPFGGAKGYALGMVVDLFSGMLTGSPVGPYVSPMYADDLSERRKLGHFMLAIDIGRFTNAESYAANMKRMVQDLGAMPPAPGYAQVMLPGEPERRRAQIRLADGIPLTEDLIDYLRP
ncbi:Ldh family oxidoreductase [Paenibacillus sacheonensis]|uniref:Ureidoglycolate dehydrogenase n=1 Tax=Paenibacillus sacheonensis TaxID=742054 RepID=A0A7X4YPT1_9BACL|nr:Ldh family oxidoreductase [Paenibacillus sacheonensis]MBM7564821.1 ureidoglycolate dehydrogenase (NAD+) [Paenibacillus sacheonensis]NBC69369.1 ureidoglycolate dehydrogenase [Paenibacillus sacheonensis]